MTGRLEIDFAILTEKLQQVCDQIEPYGRVADFLENEKVITKCILSHFILSAKISCAPLATV